MRPGAWPSIATLSLSVFCAAGANAATLTIAPVSVILDSGQTSAVIEVKNSEPNPVTVQARIYGWSQAGNEDVLAPTSDIVMSPPIATIAAGGSQTLRLLLRPGAQAGTDRERHYRILLDEIPDANARRGRVSFAMRSSIPVFVMRPQPPTPSLGWRATRDGDGQVVITATNSAAVYDRIFELTATLNDGSVRNGVLRGTNAYVLPHAQRQWVIPGGHGTGPIRLNITTRNGKTEQNLSIGQ
ncbi:MAG: molecular chaperone [Sphingomicrobium sp.]